MRNLLFKTQCDQVASPRRGIPKLLIMSLLMLIVLTQQQFTQSEQISRRLEDEDEADDSANQIIEGADQDTTQDTPPTANQQDKDERDAEKATNKRVDQKAIIEVKKRARTRANVGKQNLNDFELEDIKERYKRGEYQIKIQSIAPKGGPINGRTRVLTRFDNLSPFVDVYPHPRCKFGANNMVVEAAYVKCTKKELGFYAREKSQVLNSVCVQCEAAPAKDFAEIISFTVSLTGDFDDAASSMPYRYYNKLKVSAIYPRYGPKDGDTVVEVWGENFLDLGDDFRCNFGTQSTKAHFINSNYLWCRSAVSDVVERAMPFSVSLNRQQNSLEKHSYWFYNMQSLFKVEPDYGSMNGDQKITLKGQNFKPFDWGDDIDNQNDTFCSFGPLGKRPAQVISQTEAECLTPPNPQKLTNVAIKLTLNNQNYTDEEKLFVYFNPPNVVDVGPLLGPVTGGTVVNFWGSEFQKGKKIICSFGIYNVTGKYISHSQIQCEAPTYLEPGNVKLKISYAKDRFASDTFTFKYYADPIITSIIGGCGPIEGYTQFTILGRNFEEIGGIGKTKCIFNNTQRMNATVIDKSTIVCDSPTLESTNGDMWYNISVTLDGMTQANSTQKFKYYNQPTFTSVDPPFGPLEGGTNLVITGKGFKQANICDFQLRFGCKILPHTMINDTAISVTSFPSNMSGAVVASVTGNGQQFINDITLHFRDRENTFEYYQPFFVEWIQPDLISNAGSSPILLRSMHFDQFRHDNGTIKQVPIQCRFIQDNEEAAMIGKEQVMKRVSNDKQICRAPKTDYLGDARIQLSANGQQWQNSGFKVKFYNGPKVTAVNPAYGVTKNPKKLSLTIIGDNFDCTGEDCKKIRVRFTNDKGDQIYQDGQKDGQNIKTIIPKYPAPETLRVDISMNGQDFTADNVTYGFMDPYVLQISPRIYAPKSGIATLHGYGFVQMDESQTQCTFLSEGQQMMCPGSDGGPAVKCVAQYKVVNERTIQVPVPDQTTVTVNGIPYDKSKPFEIAMMDMDKQFQQNGIKLYYFVEFTFKSISSQFAYNNEEKPLMIDTDFKWDKGNDFAVFRKNANLTCRFQQQSDTPIEVVVPAYMEASPIGGYLPQQLPNQIRCRTPKWNNSEITTFEISANGQDYMQKNFQMTFVENLKILRMSPMAGPIEGATKVKFYGFGYTSSIPMDKDVFARFGTADSNKLDKSNVNNQDKWNEDAYHNELNIPKGLLKDAEANDVKIEDDTAIRSYLGSASPDISTIYSKSSPDVKFMGGPVYVTLSEKVPIEATIHPQSSSQKSSIQTKKRLLASSANTYTDLIETTYPDSSNLEFYYYRQPFVKKIEPNMGLATGGTPINITGGWFAYLPQYGVMPFCRIGDTIIRATYVQTNRIVCKTPPSVDTAVPSPIAVSLNGVDFKDTGFTFSYYEKPILLDIQPRSGKAEGGTEIWLKGQKFSRITQGMRTVKCRFRQVLNETTDEIDDDNAPTKFVPAYWIDKETMKCASPAGFSGNAKVKVDLTFNGADYTDNTYDFYLYNVFQSFPKSGPADATNQYIQVKGKGFRSHFVIMCALDDVDLPPISVKNSVIKCPMHQKDWPVDKYDTIPFHIVIDGVKKDFGNFHYYKQIEIDGVNPLIGPNEGKGSIYFSGKYFRNDFENARLGCRIGNTLATAQIIDSETIKCTMTKKIPLVDEGQSLPVSVALNSYSWAPSEYSFSPYGIIDLFPTSGPVGDNTNINVVGKGFLNDLQESARCRFGTEENYQVVEAQVLDDEHLICKSPSDSMSLPEGASNEISIPFGIAFQDDLYYPYTEGIHKFRMYNQPLTVGIEPVESPVQKLTEVFIYATDDDEQGFKQAIPSPGKNHIQSDMYGPKCKFGRFGTSQAVYINTTTIVCLTPTISEDPSDISEEQVTVSVAMNGVDFNDDISRSVFTFVGTGGGLSTWVIIMGTLIFGLLIVSVLIFVSGMQAWWKQGRDPGLNPYTETNQLGRLQPRSQSRGSAQPQFRNAAGSNVAADQRLSAMRSRMQNSRMQGANSRGTGFGSQAAGFNNRFNV